MLLSDALGGFLASLPGCVSPSTELYYRRRLPSLLRVLGDVPVDGITLADLRAWRNCLAGKSVRYQGSSRECPGGLSPWTLHQYVRCARRFFRWLHDESLVTVNPAKRLPLPRLPSLPRRGIPDQDRLAILAACESERDRVIVLFLWSTGCRVGGLAGLRLEDLDVRRRRARVVEKGDKPRTVIFDEACASALAAYLAVRPGVSFSNLLVGELRGKARSKYGPYAPLQESGIYQVLERLALAAGVTSRFNPHEFRHARIRHWLKNRMPVKQVSQLAGHSTARLTLDIYGTSNDDELQEAFDRYS